MKNTIRFLEELGENANFRLDRIDFEAILDNDDFDPKVREAIINKDQQVLELLLNARSKIVCMIVPAEEEDDKEEDDGGDDKTKKNDPGVSKQQYQMG
ncbi:MAG: hypothetical protein COW84_08200 [Gammaproteobacteria bacterium CG22_combo_CG10-13_8_21_14_all_40_8]|nr:MAG: hypothetical protein COW84_08200 [Gammaproteobacteria bacterium CG22_combo_CG10-13_8_21_14_all_40_8]